MAGNTLPEKVSQIYYTYGLFCSSYPATAVFLSLSVVLLCCYPLLNVPLPGNIPTVVNLPLHMNSEQNINDCSVNNCHSLGYPFQMDVLYNETQKLPHVWVKDKPFLYIHQIIMRIGVSPWNSNLKMWDAFRAPLQEVFRLLETVRNHEDPNLKGTLLQYCYHIENVKRRNSKANTENVLPEYSCLLLSPANLWQQNLQSFSLDANIINTVYNYQNLQTGKVSIAEMAFGLHLKDTGIKRYPLRSRPRVLQYAITIFYQHADERFINSLSDKLREMYPLYQDSPQSNPGEVSLIYYPGQFNYRELVPLMITFIGLFLYVYFSVRKIEFIKSKFGLAACSVVTIAASLSMSMGICFYFGFSLSLQGKEIFPYLVIIVGLENILVLTKSVTSTDSRLDVKIRLAQGLSKEGWSITKNLLTEITILTVSFFTFVPFIQEFSIFMIVSLISDYFIQMVFFATILGIDVRRMEFYPEQNNKLYLKEYFNGNNVLNWRYNKGYMEDYSSSPSRMTKSKSHPRLNGLAHNSPTDVVAQRNPSPGSQDARVPKRIRLVNMWARTRFFQRAFMVWMLVWISMIVYNSGVVEYFIANIDKMDNKGDQKRHKVKEEVQLDYNIYNSTSRNPFIFTPLLEVDSRKAVVDANETIFLKYSPHYRPWSRLTPYHWSTILSQYNESLAGRYVVVLPPVLLSHRVSPELAAGVRHLDERDPPPLRWQALAAALDPIDILPDFEYSDGKTQPYQWGKGTELPIYPTTPMEILLLAILCSISVAVIAYMMVVLYRCICSRHYAEWRASWNEDEEYRKIIAKQPAVQLVMEAVPIVVAGHNQEVECLVTDGERVVSSCLQGNVKVWESLNGEMITNIDRQGYFKLQHQLLEPHIQKIDAYEEKIKPVQILNSSDVAPDPTQQEMPRLRKGLSSHLKNIQFRNNNNHRDINYLTQLESTKYDFAKVYRELYCSDRNSKYDTRDIDKHKDTNCNGLDFDEIVPMRTRAHTGNGLRNRREKPVDRTKSDVNSDMLDWRSRAIQESPIWCMDFCNDLIILGCADGRLEFWEASTGKLLCVWWFPATRVDGVGVSHVKALAGARRVCAASLAGHVTLLRLDVYTQSGAHVDWNFSTAHRRTHKRTGSADLSHSGYLDDDVSRTRMRFSYDTESGDSEEVVCIRIAYCRPHQQPITELHSEGGRILTGGQDHILKVFSSSELTPLFTLHGHCGPITSCFIDHATPTIAGSGSQDGLLCVWDLHTGACLYSMQAHDGTVTSLTYTASYVVSAGADERLCIWDRFQGHMLNSIHIGLSYMSRMLPLTHTMLVMGDRSGLTAYDLSSGDVIRRVLFGQSDGCIFVRQILPLKDAIVCDYANQLRIVRFPLVSKLEMKND
ncbi:sterol regulatory element-binding protein cleavage-activating protein [Aricia agestis]|uniref:sterol regulatory element-binding protein cleavage-activating protein n=1 Tax=Aricia agestis TaxID=91739 RepID=UPI001C20C22F|nr:sterol regulatory element-binding protein cleavage-activating protein [Aricia agestis]XP_041986622.1 sterol regulatory element-binding protein cleavage-activating protein [Aricia agestis]XP_041986623.1 sterol regulatory element-binding protein cleavage-activating protein [Aricia agestis]